MGRIAPKRQGRAQGYAAGVPEPPPVTGISELVLEVQDLDAASAFYRDVLGFEETLHGEGRDDRLWYLVGHSARIGLWTPQEGIAGGRGGTHVHFALHVPAEDFEPFRKRLTEAGAELIGPIRFSSDRAVYVHDPDGNVLEFWTQDMAAYTAEARASEEE
jgi:catechol 2,3-dioxygenase-like lactoylglutathione lyase family enzyme